MAELRYTLVADGVSDRALLPLLTWVLRQRLPGWAIQPEWADLGRMPRPPRQLAGRIEAALNLFPCDLLFVHRDAEAQELEVRQKEIDRALAEIGTLSIPVVRVIPVRMQETWLLIDQGAIRCAAGNPNGKQPLGLPALRQLDRLPDAKSVLQELLREASGLRGRRRRLFDVSTGCRRVPEFIDNFSALRALSAFQVLEAELNRVLAAKGWVGEDTVQPEAPGR